MNQAPRNRLAFSTRTIHGGQSHDPTTGAVMVPIYATSTYGQQSPGVHKGFEYARSQNPTRFAFERAVADLESGAAGFAFASGLAAIATVFELLDSGAHIVATDDIYGGTFRLLERVRKRSAGLQVSFVDFTDLAAVEAAIRPETKMLWVETPTNPLLRIVDLAGRRGAGQAQGPDLGRRQHLLQPLHPAAARARHRSRRAFDHQISERPFRHGRRLRRGRRQQGSRRPAEIPAERDRRDLRAVRQLPGAARHQDAGAQDGAAFDQRPAASPSGWRRAATCGASSIPASPAIRSTPSPRRRCRRSAA